MFLHCFVLCIVASSFCAAQHIIGSLKTENGIPVLMKLNINSEPVSLKLQKVVGFLSPEFLLVLRGEGGLRRNTTAAHPSCLYRGRTGAEEEVEEEGEGGVFAALSTCSDHVSAVIVVNNTNYNVEFVSRVKREAEDLSADIIGDTHQMVITRTPAETEHRCGLTSRNLKKMKVAERPVVRLRREARRSKRSSKERVIEIAVFVDYDMYQDNLEATEAATTAKIQDLVFTYLNAVQLLYQSSLLTNKLRLVLVRLDIMTSQPAELSTGGGDIETYLENFCRWQKVKNPGSIITGDADNSDHWDHALLLTGLDLYDVRPSQDSVIGLAWVSGMCHPEYSCTINEGHSYESVFVIAHEMGHNLGMVHDGERTEGNTCSPDSHLMSPVLGPGKVTWSSCSNAELTTFLTGPETRIQATCLDDIPSLMDKYDFNSEQQLPGEKVSAMTQCVQALGSSFKPYLKSSQSPFEDLCRELWCSNLTHALRAHPALEGTDCSSKPYPYGSECRAGQCVPYNPNTDSENEIPGSSSGSDAGGAAQPVVESVPATAAPASGSEDVTNGIDDTPSWYDPIYNRIFSDLRRKFKEMNPVLMMNPNRNAGSGFISSALRDQAPGNTSEGVWLVSVGACPVECGGGWSTVDTSCQTGPGGATLTEEKCDQNRRPLVNKLPCATRPCP